MQEFDNFHTSARNVNCEISLEKRLNRGIKHDFHPLTFAKVPREVLKTESEARGFQPSRGTLRMLMNNRIMFDRYSILHKFNKTLRKRKKIDELYFITSSHFPTRVRYA